MSKTSTSIPLENHRIAAAGVSILIASGLFLSLNQQRAPNPLPQSASPTEFSAERAARHLGAIAQRPHPIGSTDEVRVRHYIMSQLGELGVEARVDAATVVVHPNVASVSAANVNNIVASLRGTAGSKAVLLVGHYDSVPGSPGASDDGSGVAIILETLRALKAGPSLMNDVICLFSDAEEVGSLGARAFVEGDPAVKDVGLVLNLEARGNSGPSIMFETTPGNARLIANVAKALPNPVTTSVASEIYKHLPNGTDLTVFRDAGYPGLNFAFINGIRYYHSQLDRIDQIDLRSVQHQGACALALTRHFGNLSLEDLKGPNVVYFSVLGAVVVHYSEKLVGPLTFLTLAAFGAILVVALKKQKISLRGIARGFLMISLSILGVFLIITLAWGLGLRKWYSGYNGIPFLASFAAFAVFITSTLFVVFRKGDLLSLFAGGLLWQAALTAVVGRFLPAASYLFAWPLLFSLIPLGIATARRDLEILSPAFLIALSLCSIPGVLLVVPMIYLTSTAVGLAMGGILMVAAVLLMASMIPIFHMATVNRRWLLPSVSILVCFGFILCGVLSYGFDKQHAKSDSVFYIFDADSGRAFWASNDDRPDEWTTQFFSDKAQKASLAECIPMTGARIIKTQAVAADLGAPDVTLLDDRTTAGARTMNIHITTRRQAPMVSVYVDADTLGGTVDGRPLGGEAHLEFAREWVLNYWAFPEKGIDLSLITRAGQPARIKVIDRTYGLPEIRGTTINSRPDYIMPEPFGYSESTLVTKTVAF